VRQAKSGIQVLLITSRYRGDWVLPKGHREFGESHKQTAAREAREEAGVDGKILGSLGSFGDEKMPTYVMRVTKELDRWPEMFQRRRRWATLSVARRLVTRSVMRNIIEALEQWKR
jgi:8-oxo-dGTP pyrophosphatase MutT (NUDIX family)